MNNICEIVRDLLPLYVDKACSSGSARLVEEHLPSCNECTAMYNSMQSGSYETSLQLEKDNVLSHHAKAEKRKTLIAGGAIAGILCIPIIVCLIVNLAVGHALDWFFIVLTSLLVFASLTVVPLIAERQKLVYTIFSFTGSLLLLLLSCAIYTHGDWFFVAGTSVLFGLSVVCMPYLVYALPLTPFWKRNKGLLTFGFCTVLMIIMLTAIGFYVVSGTYWHTMPLLVFHNVGFVWLFFLICRYFPANYWIRAGIVSALTGGYLFTVNNVVSSVLGVHLPYPEFNLNVWNGTTVDGNIKWLMLISGIIIGAVCIIVGVVRAVREKQK